jgi:hypothetical protein
MVETLKRMVETLKRMVETLKRMVETFSSILLHFFKIAVFPGLIFGVKNLHPFLASPGSDFDLINVRKPFLELLKVFGQGSGCELQFINSARIVIIQPICPTSALCLRLMSLWCVHTALMRWWRCGLRVRVANLVG